MYVDIIRTPFYNSSIWNLVASLSTLVECYEVLREWDGFWWTDTLRLGVKFMLMSPPTFTYMAPVGKRLWDTMFFDMLF